MFLLIVRQLNGVQWMTLNHFRYNINYSVLLYLFLLWARGIIRMARKQDGGSNQCISIYTAKKLYYHQETNACI